MYTLEEKARARSLYVESGLTFEATADETGIAPQTLKKWAAEGEWSNDRAEFERDFLQLSGGLQKIKVKLVNEAVLSGDPQKIYALAALMRATSTGPKRQTGQDPAVLFLEFTGRFIEYLKSRDGEALRHLEPHLRGFAETMKQAEAA